MDTKINREETDNSDTGEKTDNSDIGEETAETILRAMTRYEKINYFSGTHYDPNGIYSYGIYPKYDHPLGLYRFK